MKNNKYIEQEMDFDGVPYFVIATIREESCHIFTNGVEVEFEAILDEKYNNVLESVEWALYDEFERQLIEEY